MNSERQSCKSFQRFAKVITTACPTAGPHIANKRHVLNARLSRKRVSKDAREAAILSPQLLPCKTKCRIFARRRRCRECPHARCLFYLERQRRELA